MLKLGERGLGEQRLASAGDEVPMGRGFAAVMKTKSLGPVTRFMSDPRTFASRRERHIPLGF